ncbi:hypothetical protein PFISCL1PPCAC_19656 [Pristionchus fissidentatus]|uniref:Nematode cuticle collagen N-terminal domain-containing protein n=1 Tax=Pristionchus fissidentatus TaxID=1538716 RepID=A0AAV5WEX5_9BILA|nr:hypothetical protein PFISCL1PPCAC_19656 [Pristionchus fissidentatus]
MTDELIEAYDEDGGGSNPNERDWKGMASAICVILVICSLIGATILVFTPVGSNRSNEERIDVEALKEADHNIIQQSWNDVYALLSLTPLWRFYRKYLNCAGGFRTPRLCTTSLEKELTSTILRPII